MKKDSLLSKELYNKQFKEFSEKQTQYKVVQELKNKVNIEFLTNIENKSVLFAGCGDGRECIYASEQKAKVTGIDISEKGIELAQKNCPNADFFVMDIEDMRFDNNHFDIIISLFVIMYKENLTNVLLEYQRVLKDKGFIIIVVPHPIRKMIKYNDGNYFVKGKKNENWRGIKRFGYYRLIEDYVSSFTSSDLKLIELMEPKPIKESPNISDFDVSYPHFLIFKLVKDHDDQKML